jgi:hypothetical protein
VFKVVTTVSIRDRDQVASRESGEQESSSDLGVCQGEKIGRAR